MPYLVVSLVALGASLLTFFSGFGLGTLLLPAMALFFPVEAAVAATAVVHLSNNVAKGALLIRHAAWPVVLRFGLPALAASWLGAQALVLVSALAPVLAWEAAGRTFAITPVKLVIAAVLATFSVLEILPVLDRLRFTPAWLALGGLLSGFFGGLSGFQGAFRSAVLVKAGLSKEAFLGTGIAVAIGVDVVRLLVYGWAATGGNVAPALADLDRRSLLLVAIAAALAGTLAGGRLLSKVTLPHIQRLVAALLLVFAIALGAGVL